MDQVIKIAVWIALFGGTGCVIVMVLPRIVIACLEIVGSVHARRARGARFSPGARSRHKPARGFSPSLPSRP